MIAAYCEVPWTEILGPQRLEPKFMPLVSWPKPAVSASTAWAAEAAQVVGFPPPKRVSTESSTEVDDPCDNSAPPFPQARSEFLPPPTEAG